MNSKFEVSNRWTFLCEKFLFDKELLKGKNLTMCLADFFHLCSQVGTVGGGSATSLLLVNI